MRRHIGVALAVVAVPTAPVVASGQAQTPADAPAVAAAPVVLPPPPPPSLPRLLRTQMNKPKSHVIIREHFTPWATPTASQARTIVAIEAARAGVSYYGLTNRVWCESRFNWAASNGQYHGLGQFAASTFYRGMSTIGSRRVVLTRTDSRLRRAVEIRTYSDGHKVRARRGLVRQRVVHKLIGTIPRSPEMTHGWAQVRIMAQAIAGRSAVHNSEWECGT